MGMIGRGTEKENRIFKERQREQYNTHQMREKRGGRRGRSGG
jgi:hypothetical protein